MPRLILDVMGGDYAPKATLDGALQAFPELQGELTLVGDEKVILSTLKKKRFKALHDALVPNDQPPKAELKCTLRIIHANETFDMDDKIKTLRSKPGASINIGCRLVKQAWLEHKQKGTEPAGFVSAGHSGAMMASALLNMGRLTGVERPAIAVTLPTLHPDGCVVLDVGANVECKPEHLRDFAAMGALYAAVSKKSSGLPRVALLSNGEERTKGTEITREALNLIDQMPCFSGPDAIGQFLGYAEGKELFKGQVDVVVTDGFTGNLVLKSLEGLGSTIVKFLKDEAKKSNVAKVGFLLASGVLRRVKKKLDYAETGAALLLGVAGYAFISHGRSNARAIKNSLLSAQSALESQFVQKIEKALAEAHAESKQQNKIAKDT